MLETVGCGENKERNLRDLKRAIVLKSAWWKAELKRIKLRGLFRQ
jgi:hypothetical protein